MGKKQASKMQIKNIADKLGLSVSTVSVVLNGRGDQVRISKETQKKVLNAAKEINYQPNIYARRLRQAANEEAPYVLALFWRRDNLNSRLGRFLEGIFQTIDLKELKIELVVQAYEPGNFMTYMDMLSSNRFSGAMICGLNEEEQKALEEREITIPIVFIGRDSQIYHSVLMDSYRTRLHRTVRQRRLRHQPDEGALVLPHPLLCRGGKAGKTAEKAAGAVGVRGGGEPDLHPAAGGKRLKWSHKKARRLARQRG